MSFLQLSAASYAWYEGAIMHGGNVHLVKLPRG